MRLLDRAGISFRRVVVDGRHGGAGRCQCRHCAVAQHLESRLLQRPGEARSRRRSSSCSGSWPPSSCRPAWRSPSSSTSSVACRSTGGPGSPTATVLRWLHSGRAVPARPAGRGSRQSRRPHRRGHSRLDGVCRRIRPEHPAMRPAARHLPERAVDPVGIAADQGRRLRVRPPGLHGVGRRGLRAGRLVAHLCARSRPDPCRQRPSGPRGRFPLRPDAGARARRGHRPDARRGRRTRAAARLAVRSALGLARPDPRPGQSFAAHQLAGLSRPHRAADRGPAALPRRRYPARRPDADGAGLFQRAMGAVVADRQFPEVRRMARLDRSRRASAHGAPRSGGERRSAGRRADRGPSGGRFRQPDHARARSRRVPTARCWWPRPRSRSSVPRGS